MKTYAIHSAIVETEDLLRMMTEKYKSPAVYDNLYLFAESLENPTCPVIDLRELESLEELDNTFLQLRSETHVGRWVYINQEQGKYLLTTYFPPEESLSE